MVPITTIVHFEMPEESTGRFLSFWQEKIRDVMAGQPGIIGGIFHRGIATDAPFRYINVARWESAEALASGLKATAEVLEREQGISISETFEELGVKVTQNNYVEEIRYLEADGTSST